MRSEATVASEADLAGRAGIGAEAGALETRGEELRAEEPEEGRAPPRAVDEGEDLMRAG